MDSHPGCHAGPSVSPRPSSARARWTPSTSSLDDIRPIGPRLTLRLAHMHPHTTSKRGGSESRSRSSSSTARVSRPPLSGIGGSVSARTSPVTGHGAATFVGTGQASLSRQFGATSYSAGLASPTFNFQPDHQRSNSLPSTTHAFDTGTNYGVMAYGGEGGSEGLYEPWTDHGSGDAEDDFGGPSEVTISAGSFGPSAHASSQQPLSESTHRTSRIAAEQRRRNDLQDSFRRLSDVLPLSSERTSKKAILDRAVSTIADLQDANQALVKKLASYEERSPGGLSSTSSFGVISPSDHDLSFFAQLSPAHAPTPPFSQRSDHTAFPHGVNNPFATQSRFLHHRSSSALPRFSFDPTQLPSYKSGTQEED